MKRLFSLRGIGYIIYSLIFFAVVFYMDGIPNHSDGTSDYSTWKEWVYIPVLLVFHGLISGVVLRGSRLYVPLTVTALIGFIEALMTPIRTTVPILSILNIELSTQAALPTALAVTVNYLIFTALGVIITNTVRFLYLAIKTIWYCK